MQKAKDTSKLKLLAAAIPLAAALVCHGRPFPLMLAEKGKSGYAILAGTEAQDRSAALDLQDIFFRSTGVKLEIVEAGSAAAAGRKFFRIGAAVRDGRKELAQGEWVAEAVRKGQGAGDILLYGNSWNGSIMAVQAFCEEVLGYRHFMPLPDGEKIVRHDKVETSGLSLKGKAAFPHGYGLYMTYLYPAEVTDFCVRNGAKMKEAYYAKTERWKGLRTDLDSKDHGHGFMMYMPCKRIYMDAYKWDERIDFFAQHPEWFSMDKNGKRTDRMQLCFSNPELRKAFTKRVLERCRRVGGEGLLTIGAQDVPGAFCWCGPCRELEKKYGMPAGAYYDYLPEMCAAVAEKYPAIRIQTLAYRKEQTENFPNVIEKYPSNFICDFAPVDDNQSFHIGGKGNEKTLENLKQWCNACDVVKYWYYACTTDQPYGPVSRVAGDLRTICETGVDNVGLCGMYTPGLCNLVDWLFLRLAQDPGRNKWKLVKEYCDFAYGAASRDAMKIIWNLDSLWGKEPMFVSIDVDPDAMSIYTAEDLVKWEKTLESASAKVKGDARAERMLSWLRWDIDYLALTFWEKIAASGLAPAWLTPDTIHARMMKTPLFKPFRSELPKQGEEPKGKYGKAHSKYLLTKATGKPMPGRLAKLPADTIVHRIPQCGGLFGIEDADAVCGAAKTERLPTNLTAKVYIEKKVGFDYYDSNLKRTIRHGEIDISKATPGKYELYSLGKIRIPRGAGIHLATWWGIGQSLSNWYPEGDENREFELWASLKFIGPQFGIPVKDGRNRMCCDAFYLVDPNGRKYKGEQKKEQKQ